MKILKSNNWGFLLVIFLVMLLYNYFVIFFKDAYSIHQWRQTDCLALTMSYYEKNAPFLEPEIYWLDKQTSKTVSEFPIVYYLVAQIWKITGKQVFVFRMLNTFIVFIGLFLFYKSLRRILDDSFWAAFVVLILISSPVLAYYANNFTMDAPALGMALIGWHFYFNYRFDEKNRNFLLSLLFFVLAGLLKISALMSFLALILAEIYENYQLYKESKHQLKLNLKIPFGNIGFKLKLLVLFFLIIAGWYAYARTYTSANTRIFLLGFYPIWDLKPYEIVELARSLLNVLLPELLNRWIWLLVVIGALIVLINIKKIDRFFAAMFVALSVGVFLYVLFFYKAFDVHDYYLTNLLIFVPFVFIPALLFLKKNYFDLYTSKFLKITMSVLLAAVIFQTALVNRLKFNASGWIAKVPTINKERLALWQWYHWNYGNHFKALEELSDSLETKFGIAKNDTVISIPDASPNITLYILRRKGYTDFAYDYLPDYKSKIEQFKNWGAKYLIINDTNLLQNEQIRFFATNMVGEYKNVRIYKLK